MRQDEFNATFEASREMTCFLAEGALIGPHTIAMRLSEELGVRVIRFEMRIGTVLLAHELEQAGVELEATTLEEFVKADVRDRGETALQGYLGIVRAVVQPESTRGFMRLFGKAPAVPPVGFWIRQVDRVYVEKEALVIAGVGEASS